MKGSEGVLAPWLTDGVMAAIGALVGIIITAAVTHANNKNSSELKEDEFTLQALRTTVEVLQAESKTLREEIDSLREESKSLREESKSLQDRIESLKSEVRYFESSHRALRGKYSAALTFARDLHSRLSGHGVVVMVPDAIADDWRVYASGNAPV